MTLAEELNAINAVIDGDDLVCDTGLVPLVVGQHVLLATNGSVNVYRGTNKSVLSMVGSESFAAFFMGEDQGWVTEEQWYEISRAEEINP